MPFFGGAYESIDFGSIFLIDIYWKIGSRREKFFFEVAMTPGGQSPCLLCFNNLNVCAFLLNEIERFF